MKLTEQIYLTRVRTALELAADGADLSDEHKAALAENRRWADLAPAAPPAPARAAILAQARQRAAMLKEQPMNLLPRIFRHRTWYLSLATGLALAAVIIAVSLFLPGRVDRGPGPLPAYAATEGFVLVLDLGRVEGRQFPEGITALVDQVTAVVDTVRREHGLPSLEQIAEEGSSGMTSFTIVSDGLTVETTSGDLADAQVTASGPVQLVLSFPDGTPELLAALQAALADVPGLPAPQVADTTWFSANGLPVPGDEGLTLALEVNDFEHQFTFPPEASELEIQHAIQVWLSENRPDLDYIPEVRSATENGQRLVTVTLSEPAPAAAGAASPPNQTVSVESNSAVVRHSTQEAQEHAVIVTGDAGPASGLVQLNFGEQSITLGPDFESLSAVYTATDGDFKVISVPGTADADGAPEALMVVVGVGEGEAFRIQPLNITVSADGQPGVYIIRENSIEQLTGAELEKCLQELLPEHKLSAEVRRVIKDGATELRILLEAVPDDAAAAAESAPTDEPEAGDN